MFNVSPTVPATVIVGVLVVLASQLTCCLQWEPLPALDQVIAVKLPKINGE
jgi:hypothetical protein